MPIPLVHVGEGNASTFLVDNGIQKNLISAEVVKRLELLTTPHLQPYSISWLSQGIGIPITQQFLLPYGIKPFKDEVLCDVAPLEVCDVLLGQPYMWKHHVVYESWPHSVIFTLGGQLYRIPETVAPTTVSQGRKISSHTRKLFLFTIASEGEHKIIETSTPAAHVSLLIRHKKKTETLFPHLSGYLYDARPCI